MMQNYEYSLGLAMLSASTGVLQAAVLPLKNQPDWIIPADLVLAVVRRTDWPESKWYQQKLHVFDAESDRTENIRCYVVLEGERENQRFAFALRNEALDKKNIQVIHLKDKVVETDYPYSYQVVIYENKILQVPDFHKIYQAFNVDL